LLKNLEKREKGAKLRPVLRLNSCQHPFPGITSFNFTAFLLDLVGFNFIYPISWFESQAFYAELYTLVADSPDIFMKYPESNF